MVFTVIVSTELYGRTESVEIEFTSHPSLTQLKDRAEVEFAMEAASRKPSGVAIAPVRFNSLQVFIPRFSRWLDLDSADLLYSGCSVKAFPLAPVSAISGDSRGLVQASPPRVARRASGTNTLASPSRPNGNRAGPIALANYPENATWEEKVRIVFAELDLNRSNAIESDEFNRGFAASNIRFSQPTITDLFSKLDVSRRGGTVSDLYNWSQAYPTVLDCLYYRFRDLYEEHTSQQQIENEHRSLQSAQDRRAAAQATLEDAARTTQEFTKNAQDKQHEFEDTKEAEHKMREYLIKAQEEHTAAQRERAEREAALAAGQERERGQELEHLEAQRARQRIERKLAQQDSEVKRAIEKENQLAQLLAEARNETARQRQLLDNAKEDAESAKQNEQDQFLGYQRARREVVELIKKVHDVEELVAGALSHTRDYEERHLNAQRETTKNEERLAHANRELAAAHEREHVRRTELEEAKNAVDHQQRRVLELEDVHAQQKRVREEVHAREAPLLEQEVRLREQRDALEQKESKLRRDAIDFYETSGRVQAVAAAGRNLSPPRIGSPLSLPTAETFASSYSVVTQDKHLSPRRV